MPKWKPGESGNPKGRPRHVRERLTQEFISDLADSWKEHGKQAIETLRRDDIGSYTRLVAQLIPRDVRVEHSADSVAELLTLVTQRRKAALEQNEKVIEHVVEELPDVSPSAT